MLFFPASSSLIETLKNLKNCLKWSALRFSKQAMLANNLGNDSSFSLTDSICKKPETLAEAILAMKI